MDIIIFSTTKNNPNKGASLFMNMCGITILTLKSTMGFKAPHIFLQLLSVQSGFQFEATIIHKLQQQQQQHEV